VKNGWVWVERKSQWQPFTDFREIRKGKNKGAVEVTLPARKERKIIVQKTAIRAYPAEGRNKWKS